MNLKTKMLLMNSRPSRENGGRDGGNGGDRGQYGRDYGGGQYPTPRYDGGQNYAYEGAPEDRFRDRRGREHYDDGRYAPRNYYGGNGGEYSRQGGGYGRGGARGSRYPIPEGGAYGSYPHYPDPRFMPIYEGKGGVEMESEPARMHKIGFSVEDEMERIPDEFGREYRASVEYPQTNEFERRKGSYMAGHGFGSGVLPINKETAQRWTEGMKNEDGTSGPHWTMEQTKQIQSQRGIDCEPLKFWVAMNMVYSDYSKVAKKLNVNNADFYASMAEAFLEDKDAQADKLERYYQYVVKH